MNDFFTKPEIISAIKAGILGIIIGGVFALFRFKPPSPDNLAGIFGVLGIFIGWVIIGFFLK